MTDENAVDPSAPDEVTAQAAQDEAEAAELQAKPGPVDEPDVVEPQATLADPPQPASVTDIEEARGGPSAPVEAPGATDALSARLDALEARVAAVEAR